jgi:hypothetical protein
MLLLLVLVAALVNGLTDQEMYTQLTTSLTTLEANPTPSNLAKIRLILQSTEYLKWQTQYGGGGKKRFSLKK